MPASIHPRRAAVTPLGGTTHLRLTGRLPRGEGGRAATVWTADGATPTVVVERAASGGSLRRQRTAPYAALR